MDPATTYSYPSPLHDAFPISAHVGRDLRQHLVARDQHAQILAPEARVLGGVAARGDHPPATAVDDHRFGVRDRQDRKSTRLNSSHVRISYAVFCLHKKNYFSI